MATQKQPHLDIRAQPLLGTWRRFGVNGPVYEVIGLGKPLGSNDQVMRVKVVETGEELDYRLREILDDPREQ